VTAPSPQPALQVELAHRVHEQLVLDVSFELGAQCAVLFGKSGAGKTTVFRLISGLARPKHGVIRLDGSTLFDSSRSINVPLRARRIGMIFQDDRLFPHLEVAGNVQFGLQGWSRSTADLRVIEVAKLCNVSALLDRRVDTLSGGERQRVGLARALAPRPRLLLCDEPVSALDLPSRYLLIERLRAVQRAERIPLLFITHSPAEAIAIGDRLLLLSGGRIMADGPPLDVLAGSSLDAAPWGESIRNILQGTVTEGGSDTSQCVIALDGSDASVLRVSASPIPTGARVTLGIPADEILIASGQLDDRAIRLSARNRLPGIVEQVVAHGPSAEVVVRVGEARLTASVVRTAVDELAITPGCDVTVIIKARGIQILNVEPDAGWSGD
jgi:molybdate transport system ATP-binding protein